MGTTNSKQTTTNTPTQHVNCEVNLGDIHENRLKKMDKYNLNSKIQYKSNLDRKIREEEHKQRLHEQRVKDQIN